ncbi:MAG: conjugal transfer protein TraG N-terminal domain-containing protein [Gammaproteobacteria bacterium]|nr:conjugal transfer protein TraG N-terminal domain-containing protein [Gammaproteobacteria bacterium]
MSVDSYLELYSTMFGWMFYGVVWDVLVATGIVYLPFLGIVIDYWRKPASEAPHNVSSGISLRKMEHELLLALVVVVFAGQPVGLTPFIATTLSYTPPPTVNNPNPPTVDFSNSQSTFGTTGFGDAVDTVDVPMWWYAVIAFSSGFNHAVVEGLPRASEIRQLSQLSRLATIEDPRLRQEVSEFYSACYVPARSKFLAEQPSSTAVDNLLRRYGNTDTDWIGSHVYRDIPGYYDSLRARTPVSGWAYVPSRDIEYDVANPPSNGRPYCTQWWGHAQQGLRAKLVDAADTSAPGFATLFYNLAPALATERQLDLIARTVLLHTPKSWTSNDLSAGNQSTTGMLGQIESFAKGLLYIVGAFSTAAVFSVIVTGIIAVAPMIQAMILLGIYSLLPLIVVYSRYSFTIMITGALAIFGVKFWTVLWYLAQWIDQNMFTAMYPDTNLLFEVLTNSGEHTTKRVILNVITSCLYIGLPLLWSSMLGWTGIAIGQSLDSATPPFGQHTRGEPRRIGAFRLKNAK